MTCIYCGEIYSPRAVKELQATGEELYVGNDGFICPDCLATINRKTVDEQVKELLGIGGTSGKAL